MPNDRMVEPAENFFEYVVRILANRSKHAIDLRAFNVAREKIARKRKEKRRRSTLWLAYSSNNK